MRFYAPIEFSKNLKETPEGFLVAEGVAIARLGVLEYLASEVPIEAGDESEIIKVERGADVLFAPDTLASFEGKPITLDHPQDFVNSDNWRALSVGVVQNVRALGDCLVADLLLTEKNAIKEIKNGEFRELSCGYDADYEQTGVGIGRQTRILGNHVALVRRGRCGAQCAIKDKAPFFDLGHFVMKKMFGILNRDSESAEKREQVGDVENVENVEKQAQSIADVLGMVLARLDALEAKIAEKQEMAADENLNAGSEPKSDEAGAVDEKEAQDESGNVLIEKLDEILSLLRREMFDESQQDPLEQKAADAAFVSACAILAPSVDAKSKGAVGKALDFAYSTKDGRAVIDSLLKGKSLAAEKESEMLFFAASELLKMKRAKAFDNAAVAKQGCDYSPAALNAYYEQFYSKKG